MPTPNVPTDEPVVIGKAYMVPCVRIKENAMWWGTHRWYSVRGPKHDDSALSFKAEHYHLDLRFVPEAVYRMMQDRVFSDNPVHREEQIHGQVIQVSWSDGTPFEYESSVRKMIALRDVCDFPNVSTVAGRLRPLYENAVLKESLVCPHKGAPLLPTADAEGFSVCPLHGLCWNLKERRLATVQEEAEARKRRKESSAAHSPVREAR